MTQIKNFAIALGLISIGTAASAQIISSNEITVAPLVTVTVTQGKSSVKSGERIVLKANGLDELSAIQWQVSLDGKAWEDIAKANGNNYETEPLTAMCFYRVVTKPLENPASINVETISNVQAVTLLDNVASTKKK